MTLPSSYARLSWLAAAAVTLALPQTASMQARISVDSFSKNDVIVSPSILSVRASERKSTLAAAMRK